ncbi:putative AC transposase [Bienertia sinuspersici]
MEETHNGFNIKTQGITQLQPSLEPIRSVIKWIRVTRTARSAYEINCEEHGLRKKVWSLDTPTLRNSTDKLLNCAIRYGEAAEGNDIDAINEVLSSLIVNDILAIYASTIACEFAFSASRRVLDEKRSHLTPQSIEMCVCKKKGWNQAKKRTQGLREEDKDEDHP